MNFKKIAVLSGFILIAVTTFAVFAQEAPVALTDSQETSVDQQAFPKSENIAQWAWGEVVNLDTGAKTLTLNYLDYETDQEKELVLVTDEKTVFENVNSLEEIKLKDTLSIDYITKADGTNIAKNISFEKPDFDSIVSQEAESIEPVVPVIEQPASVVEATVSSIVEEPVVQKASAVLITETAQTKSTTAPIETVSVLVTE